VQPRTLLACAALLFAAAGGAAEPPPGGIPDLQGPRALALQATVGVAGSNDAIFVNPAALGARRRYSADVLYFGDMRGDARTGQFVGASVVDSTSAPVTAGAGYVRAFDGAYTGNIYQTALAAPLSEGFLVGVTVDYYGLDGPTKIEAATVDAGIFWQLSRYFSIGAAGYNLVPIDNDVVAPLSAAAGFAIGSDEAFQVCGQWYWDFGTNPARTLNRYSGGAEYLLGKMFALRGGYTYDEVASTQWWSAGVGIVTQSVALDFGYRQALDASTARTFSVALRVFPQM
jgi:hypothetical protein